MLKDRRKPQRRWCNAFVIQADHAAEVFTICAAAYTDAAKAQEAKRRARHAPH